MANQAERRAATRAKLIDAARDHFVRAGFEAAHTTQILADAGVSRGAMYHHFPSKKALFEAVFVAVSDAAIATARQSAPDGAAPLAALMATCLGWLRAADAPDVRAILLDQGPQVLGWSRARALEEKASLSLMVKGLERAQAAGEICVASLTLTARVVNAAMAELALARSHGDPAISVADQDAALRQLLDGLKP